MFMFVFGCRYVDSVDTGGGPSKVDTGARRWYPGGGWEQAAGSSRITMAN